MTSIESNELGNLAARGNWDGAVELLRNADPNAGAEAIMALPFDRQRDLFDHLPVETAAALVSHFPYFHAYVLLVSRPVQGMRQIIEAMSVTERDRFFDELPEEAWQSLNSTLSGVATMRPLTQVPEESRLPPAPRAPAVAGTIVLEARQVEKSYGQPDGHQIQVIAPLNLSLEADTVVALLGPSGSGKSTLLRILSGLVSPSSGEVLWHGAPVTTCQPGIGIVFQSFALFPWLTVLENVEAPLLARGMPHQERHRRALEALGSVGLASFEAAFPRELSGGMKQRVGFARALAVEPEVLFMDEPFSALDVLTAENLRGDLMELWAARKIPTRCIFLVTHNIEEAVLLADRVVVIGGSPAKIRADFRLPLARPRDRKSASFLLYVDYIYKVITQPQIELAPPAEPRLKPRFERLPHSRPGGVAGLLELLVERNGEDDIYHISDDLLWDIGDLLPIIQAATLLGFATAGEGDVTVTSDGRAYAEADIRMRKVLFRKAVLERVGLLQHIQSALASKSDHSMPLEFFRDLLDEHFTDEEVQQQLQTALDWGRYADLFTYDADTDRVHLYEPSPQGAASAPLH